MPMRFNHMELTSEGQLPTSAVKRSRLYGGYSWETRDVRSRGRQFYSTNEGSNLGGRITKPLSPPVDHLVLVELGG